LGKQLQVTWVKSGIGYPKTQKLVIRSLGLKKLNHTVTHADTPEVWGMINKVAHLVKVKEVE
jgi:large subunit ribosomal protein L30